MDVCKPERRLHKLAAADSTRSPLVSAEKNNGRHKSPTPSTPSGSRHSRTREVGSRHKSPTPSTPSGSRRCPSPTPTRTTPTPSPGVQKRAVSAERKRPSTPPSLQIPSTPVHDSSIAVPISSRRLSTGRTPESLWPSTMRNLSVSFQSDTLSPVSKKEKGKPVSNVTLDRTLRPSSNVARIQQSETSTLSRKPSPDRKRKLLEGKNAPDQSENAKPVDGLPSRLIDHHRWPSRIGGKLSNSLNISVDQGDKIVKNLSTKRMPMSDNSGKPLLKSSNDAARLLSLDDIGRVGFEESSIDDKPRRASFPASILSTSSLDKTMLTASGSRSQSPSKTSVSRGVSPHLARPSTPTARGVSPTPRGVSPTPRGVSPTPRGVSPTPRGVSPTPRGVSPIRTRTSTSSSQSHSSTPVLSPTPRVVSPIQKSTSTSSTQSHSSTPVLSPTQMKTSTSSSQPHSSTSVLSSTPRVVSPTRVRTSTSSSQSHSSTSALSSTPMVASPTHMRTPASSIQSHSSTSTSSGQSLSLTSILSSTPRVVSPIRVRTSTSSSQSHSSTSVLSSTPRVLSPTRMRTPTSSRRTHSRSHSSSSVLSSTLRGVSPTPRGVSPTPRGASPTPRGVSPTPRVVSPTRMRTSTPLSQSHSSTSVLSFITDFKKGRKSASYIEDAHQLHLLYNRYLQWRFANAHAEDVLYIQKVNAEETLYNVWNATLGLCDALIKKKINLQRLKLELKLNSVLNNQMGYLNDWALLERDHISSLAGAEENLEATTLRVPITGGAKADIESLKAAICSAVDVMQAMGSSICSSLPKVEGVNSRVSELAAIAAQEKNMLDQCEALLSSTAAMQLEECSLSSHLMQTKQPLKKNKQPTMAAAKTFPWP
ncbi:hypothetical protein HRI_003427700 [Hibiscus trionum]|uniref:AUGMIN subunit 8 n=1 Tax=Hibiscus trionum TaxID=183268 RepID=A0A9W7IK45_HIBTR|nr:hypothetical protein HRI_003427700 [Hibiscus trionum]